MQMQAIALVVSALLSVLGGWLLASRKWLHAGVLGLALVAFWAWFNNGVFASVPVIHAAAGMFLLAAAGVCLAFRCWLPSALLGATVAVVWVGSYYRMSIQDWVQGGNDEKLYWFQLLGNVTAWGLLAIGGAVLLALLAMSRKIKTA